MKHPRNFIDRKGQTYGRLVVLEYAGCSGKHERSHWKCKCSCGSIVIVQGKLIGNGTTKSCGCLRKEAHPNPLVDLTGKKFGRLTVVRLIGMMGRYKRPTWLCACRCGSYSRACSGNLVSGNAKSCGCYNRDMTGFFSTTHGETKDHKRSKEYRAWKSIKDRCYLKTAKSYERYGGRGITMCMAWMDSFPEFLKDVGRAPSADHSIERKDNNGNYEPGNVRWATVKEQARNKRTNVFGTFNGRTLCWTDWAIELGISKFKIWRRLNAGWSIGRIIAKYKKS